MTAEIEKANTFVEILTSLVSVCKDVGRELKEHILHIALFFVLLSGVFLYFPLDILNLEFQKLSREYWSFIFVSSVVVIITYGLTQLFYLRNVFFRYLQSKQLIYKLKHLPKKEKWLLWFAYQVKYSSIYKEISYSSYSQIFRFNQYATPFLTSLYKKGIFTQLTEGLYYDISELNSVIREYLLLTEGKCLIPSTEQEEREADAFLNEISNISDVLKSIDEMK
ncbi:MAG: hypothetical protein V8R11_07220 [Alphaproteobacteria bacterium]|nr:hypothetical protein [Acetobacter sp.]